MPSSEPYPPYGATQGTLQRRNAWEKVVAVGTDGSPNITGEHTGSSRRMQKDGKTHPSQIHNLAQRTALCMPSALRQVPELAGAEVVAREKPSNFSRFRKRYGRLQDFKERCGGPVHKLHQIHDVRQSSRHATLASIRRSAQSPVQYVAAGEPRCDIAAVIGAHHFQRTTTIMCDVLSIMNRLSLFREDSIDTGRYESELNVARTSLRIHVSNLGATELAFLESKKTSAPRRRTTRQPGRIVH